MIAKKILIVDDDPDTVLILVSRLKAEGYEMCVAQDGLEAVIKAKEERPDLIILDVLLPKMTGYEALWKIRKNREMEHIPVIVISAKAFMEKYFQNISHVEFLAKPYNPAELSEKVCRLAVGDGNPEGSGLL